VAEKILILGGTAEAARLAADLVAAGHDVTTSLAGRTREPRPVAGKVRVGGFSGPEGLARFLRTEKIDRLIDATHPFAQRISANAKIAARLTGVVFEARARTSWPRRPGDNWIEVDSLEQARDALPPAARVLLAIGSQHLDVFRTRADVRFVVRRIDPPEQDLGFADYELIIGRPGNLDAEMALLRDKRITHIVCRNSGGGAGYAKIEAARQLRIPVVMISRPGHTG
jgi:precorrin-6A/cobalt-precorrin-6A reductase